jgi:hypothetical protein
MGSNDDSGGGWRPGGNGGDVNPYGLLLILGMGIWWYLERTRPNGRLNPENRKRVPRV